MKAEYLGETSKSLRDRAAGHMKALRGAQSSSFILRHNLLHHKDDDPFCTDYTWEALAFFQKPMDRQVAEALAIKEAYGDSGRVVLNAKTEYSRCVLPGITPAASEEDKEQEEAVQRLIKDIRRKKGLPDKEEADREEQNPEGDQQVADPGAGVAAPASAQVAAAPAIAAVATPAHGGEEPVQGSLLAGYHEQEHQDQPQQQQDQNREQQQVPPTPPATAGLPPPALVGQGGEEDNNWWLGGVGKD